MNNRPQLPHFFSAPLRLIPDQLHTRAVLAILNRLFREQLDSGEMDFLEARTVVIEVSDVGVALRFTKGIGRLVAHTGAGPVDLAIRGQLYDFIQLAQGEEDPDTLFFQRRIRLEGSVELGLEVKNLLYGIEFKPLPIPASLRLLMEGEAVPFWGK